MYKSMIDARTTEQALKPGYTPGDPEWLTQVEDKGGRLANDSVFVFMPTTVNHYQVADSPTKIRDTNMELHRCCQPLTKGTLFTTDVEVECRASIDH